eukprot:10993920-Alexandrium_andersonii.AAC.1
MRSSASQRRAKGEAWERCFAVHWSGPGALGLDLANASFNSAGVMGLTVTSGCSCNHAEC